MRWKTISTTKIPIDLIEPTPATGDSVTNITQNYATNSSPSFTGTATFESATLSSSPSATNNSNSVATTKYVKDNVPPGTGLNTNNKATKLTYVNSDGKIVTSTENVGSTDTPVYLYNGEITKLSGNVGNSAKHVYLNNGTITAASTTIGSTSKPVYVNNGSISKITVSKGNGGDKLVYFSDGEILESTKNIGDSNKFVYLSSGQITASSTSKGGTKKPIYLSSGEFKEFDSTSKLGSSDSPIYINSSGQFAASSNKFSDYLTTSDASNTYVTKSDADSTYAKSANVSDTKVTSTALSFPASDTNYYMVAATSDKTATAGLVKFGTNARIQVKAGTTTTEGKSEIILGNSTATGTDGNVTGQITLYNTAGKYHIIKPHAGDTTSRTIYTPKGNGTLVIHTTDKAVGDSNTPVYISADGIATSTGKSFADYVTKSDANSTYATKTELTNANTSFTNNYLAKSVADSTYATKTALNAKAELPATTNASAGQVLKLDSNKKYTWASDNNTTYSTFVGSGKNAKSGLVPAPSTTAGTAKYLREDGSWQVPPGTSTTYSTATTTANGLMSSTDKVKLNGIAENANNYTHPTSAGNKHIPSGGATGNYLVYDSAGTAKWSSAIPVASKLETAKTILIETWTASVSYNYRDGGYTMTYKKLSDGSQTFDGSKDITIKVGCASGCASTCGTSCSSTCVGYCEGCGGGCSDGGNDGGE